MLVLRSGQSTA